MSCRLPGVPAADTGSRPSVLVVDDHRGVLEKVVTVLAHDFDIAGVATDGRRAVSMAGVLAPDVIVLDINMPGLDGYQTKSALDDAGSRAPVVFLSMFDAEEYVSEAFRRGGRGYVLKPFLGRDLTSALHHVLHSRLFVPSLVSLLQLANGGGHALQLYGDPVSFLDGLAGFFDLALRRGDATYVIATQDIRDGLSDRLRARGWETGKTSRNRCQFVDAAAALDRFMRNGLPDPSCLAEIVSELDQYRLANSKGDTCRLTLFGNMGALLLREGNLTALVALETMWNSMTHRRPCFTLCGYSITSQLNEVPELWSETCAAHWAVSHASGI
jgi:CheY-like chemotaxis protein